MNVEAASDVDTKYQLNPHSIVSIQVHVGDVGRRCVGVYSNICVVCKINVKEWCCEVVGSCEVEKVARCGFLLPCNLIKTCMCM